MSNQVVLVGRLVAKPIVEENENGRKVSEITLAVPRSFKNAEGVYETGFIKCTLWNGIAETTCEYCNKGDIVGVKGRLETNVYEKENGEKTRIISIIAEKITFLSSHNNTNDNVNKED